MTTNSSDSSGKNDREKSDGEKSDGVQADWFTRSVDIQSIDEDISYCALPADFFAFALRDKHRGGTSLLTIDSWDGREILSVLRRQ